MKIPSFIDFKALTINRTANTVEGGKSRTELQAVDPQGDTVVIRRECPTRSNGGGMPQVELTVSYKDHESPDVAERKPIGTEEAYDLYRCLKQAKNANGVNVADTGWIISDLARKGGAGGAR